MPAVADVKLSSHKQLFPEGLTQAEMQSFKVVAFKSIFAVPLNSERFF